MKKQIADKKRKEKSEMNMKRYREEKAKKQKENLEIIEKDIKNKGIQE